MSRPNPNSYPYRKSDTVIYIVFGALILFCFYGCSMGVKQSNEFARKCREAGGVPFQPKYDWVCLKKDQVQEM